MIRRYGEAVKTGQVYRHRPGVYAILPRNHQILLTFQEAPTPEFQLPGGGIDAGEHPIAALHREVFEETGWRIADPRKIGAFRRFVFMPEYNMWAEKVCHIYMALPVRPHGPPSEPGHSAHWMAADGVPDMLGNEGDRAFVAGVLARR